MDPRLREHTRPCLRSRRHPEWHPTVSIFADARLLNDTSANPSVRYIYDKQLEEAQVLVDLSVPVVVVFDRLIDPEVPSGA